MLLSGLRRFTAPRFYPTNSTYPSTTEKALAPLLVACAALFCAAPASARTWYVRAGTRGPANGTNAHPFANLAAVQRASKPGDTIIVLPSNAPLDGGIALKPRQTLQGRTAGRTRPRIENTTPGHNHGDAIELATGDTVRNLTIGPAFRGGIYGRDVTNIRIAGNDLSHTNTSCTTGFVVQPFKLPTLVSGAYVPFSSGLPNGWAAIMVDEDLGSALLTIRGNRVHDSGCADGIDVRASRAARTRVTVTGNTLTRLRQAASQQSVLAIGMQTIGHAHLTAQLSGNRESYIGSATAGDQGFADSEGLFANSAGRSQLIEHVDRNTFAHGLGHLSANCFEVVSSNGGPTMHVTLEESTCRHVVGDILEAVNLSANATMTLALDHVLAQDSEFAAGPAFHQAEPGDDGDCLFELAAGAATSTDVRIDHSTLTGCVTDGLEAASSVDDGVGPVKRLSFEVQRSRITGNRLSNLRVANSSTVNLLDGRITHTSLALSPGTPIILENLDRSGATHPHLQLGPGDCIFTGSGPAIEDARDNVSAQGDWWGQPGGPTAGEVVAAGAKIDHSRPLGRQPGC